MSSKKQQEVPLTSTLIARFLRSNNYTETLRTFIREASLPSDAGQSDGANEWTIERILDEKRVFDETLKFERYADGNEAHDVWSVPAPSQPEIIQTPTSANVLAASVERWQHADGASGQVNDRSCIIATSADRRVHVLRTVASHEAVVSLSSLSDSPILSYASVRDGRHMFMTTMSGQLLLVQGSEVKDRRKDHAKYAVKVICFEDTSTGKVWVATAGWDSTVHIYCLTSLGDGTETEAGRIGEPSASIHLASHPESILFIRHAESGDLILLCSRRDSTYLYYYEVEPPRGSSIPVTNASSTDDNHEIPAPRKVPECRLLGKQNLAPHSNSWIAFSPSCLALSPHDPGLLAVATSSLPHMKLIIVRLLFPSSDSMASDDQSEQSRDHHHRGDTNDTAMTQATQALAALALQNREDAAILIQANTFAPQTAYSTPQVVWRPDGCGLWVNGDDGVIRGIEAKTGKVTAVLKNGHEAGCKIRTIWAGWVDDDESEKKGDSGRRREWLISGGFDKRLVVWKTQ